MEAKTKYPSENCDSSCYYHCTKNGQQELECVTIKNNDDLPNDYTPCWFIVLGVIKNGIFNSKSFLETEIGNIYYGGVSHYQPITKPKLPIF